MYTRWENVPIGWMWWKIREIRSQPKDKTEFPEASGKHFTISVCFLWSTAYLFIIIKKFKKTLRGSSPNNFLSHHYFWPDSNWCDSSFKRAKHKFLFLHDMFSHWIQLGAYCMPLKLTVTHTLLDILKSPSFITALRVGIVDIIFISVFWIRWVVFCFRMLKRFTTWIFWRIRNLSTKCFENVFKALIRSYRRWTITDKDSIF